VPAIAMPDIAGYWPHTTRPVRGPQEYAKRIIDLLDFIPDFRAEPIEHATNRDVMFVRWIARGMDPKGPFEAVGVDRLIVPNGYVAETFIFWDHRIFDDSQRCGGAPRSAWRGNKGMPLKPPQAAAPQPSMTASPAWAASASDSRRVTRRIRSG